MGGKSDPRNWKNGGPGRAFLPRSRRPKFQNFLAPLPLRSGRSAKAPLRKKLIPPAPEGGQGKPLPLYPPSDASASTKIVMPRRPPGPACPLRWLKTPCKSIPAYGKDVGVKWVSGIDFIFGDGAPIYLTKKCTAFLTSLSVSPDVGSN